MSLPPIYTKTRVSLSVCRPQPILILTGSKEVLLPQSKLPIAKQSRKLKPEFLINKSLEQQFSASPSIEHLKLPSQRLSPVSPTTNLYQKVKKTSYLKRDFVDSIKAHRISEISANYTKPIRDYFEGSAPLHKSFLDSPVKKEEKMKIENKNEKKLTPIERYRMERIGMEVLKEEAPKRKVVHTKRYAPEARSSFKKTKIEVSYSKYIHENLQTDWNSFNLEEWELDPYA